MKRDSLDEALRRKLHDAEAGLPVPPWAEMQRRMQLHANAHPAERVPLFRSWSRYAAAAVVLLGIGLGVWRCGTSSTAVSWRSVTPKNSPPGTLYRCRFPFPVAIPPRGRLLLSTIRL